MTRIGLAAAIVLLAGCGLPDEGPAGPTAHDRETIDVGDAALTRVRLTMGAGELDVRGGAQKLLEADFTYNLVGWKPSITRGSTGADTTIETIEIVQGSQKGVRGRTENRWEVALNDHAPLEVQATIGAGEARLKLGTLNLRGVALELGAGEVELDLRGTPPASYNVELRGGVGSATVYLPASAAISAKAAGGLGAITVTGLEQRDGRWVNPQRADAPVRIGVDVQGGVGQVTIVAE